MGHVVYFTDGNDRGPIRKDPLTRHGTGWDGERVAWDELWRFTEAKKDGQRAYGSPDAIACAVVKVGDQTGEERLRRKMQAAVVKAAATLQAQQAQTRLATDERDAALTDARLAQRAADELRTALTTTQAALTDCQNRTPVDCTEALNAERARVLDAMVEALTETAGSLR